MRNNTKLKTIYTALKNSSIVNNEERLKSIIESSNPENIGTNYYLTIMLKDFLPKQYSKLDDKNELVLEKEFLEMVNNVFYSQIMNKSMSKKVKALQEGFYAEDALEFMANASLISAITKSKIDQLAQISMQKIVNDYPISEKDYGYIINKIALFIGQPLSAEYNKLLFGITQELISSNNYGNTAEKYLNDMLRQRSFIDYNLIGTGLNEEPKLNKVNSKKATRK